mgnify:CR=1 FL=1
MKIKKANKKINTIQKSNFIPLQAAINRKLKSSKFRQVFSDEISRLKLAHDIKALRQQRKMTQEQVATATNMPQSVIARIESGTHSFSIATLHRIARVFDRQIGLVK